MNIIFYRICCLYTHISIFDGQKFLILLSSSLCLLKMQSYGTSSQDGGISKHGLPPHTATTKLQINCRPAITQNHQKSTWMEVRQL